LKAKDKKKLIEIKTNLGFIEKEMARRHLLSFCSYTFPGYVLAPHLRLVAEKLEAVERGEIKRLMIFMPPRYGKSELAAIRFPAWYLGRNKDNRIIFTSYASSLACSFSRKIRNLIADEEIYPFEIKLAKDSTAVDAWNLEKDRGGLIAAGVNGGITGHGANLFIIDDPVASRLEASSAVYRQRIWDWYLDVARTRLEPDAAIILIMTRWHEDDLAGRLIKAQESEGDIWEILRLPARAEENDPLGRNIGEPLWPEKYDETKLLKIEKSSARVWASLYQQKPRIEEGNLIKGEWFKFIPEEPAGIKWVRFWDLAYTEKQISDFTVGCKAGLWQVAEDDIRFVISDISRRQQNWPEAKRRLKNVAQIDGQNVSIFLEEVAAQKALIQELQVDPELTSFSIRGARPETDKVARAQPWIDRAESGFVYLVRGEWNKSFIDEAESFPNGTHDDQIDAVSGAYSALGENYQIIYV